jgi:hypothetical protein
MEFSVDIVDERIRPRDTVFGDVIPELDQIISGTGTLQNDAHLCFGSTGLGCSFRAPFPLDLLSIPSRDGAATQRRRNMRQRSSRSVVHKDPVMCLDQIRQLLAGQQQLERAALAWCPLYESQLLQAQDHLMD